MCVHQLLLNECLALFKHYNIRITQYHNNIIYCLVVVRARTYKRGIKIFNRYIGIAVVCVCTYYYSKKNIDVYIKRYGHTEKTEVVANFSIYS